MIIKQFKLGKITKVKSFLYADIVMCLLTRKRVLGETSRINTYISNSQENKIDKLASLGSRNRTCYPRLYIINVWMAATMKYLLY